MLPLGKHMALQDAQERGGWGRSQPDDPQHAIDLIATQQEIFNRKATKGMALKSGPQGDQKRGEAIGTPGKDGDLASHISPGQVVARIRLCEAVLFCLTDNT